MGEIAEDMIDGSCCALCGVYFMELNEPPLVIDGTELHESIFTHGHSVACVECWEEDCGFPLATNKLTF